MRPIAERLTVVARGRDEPSPYNLGPPDPERTWYVMLDGNKPTSWMGGYSNERGAQLARERFLHRFNLIVAAVEHALLCRLARYLPPDAQGLAGEAASGERVALAVLCDWLREHGGPGVGDFLDGGL